jgi:hypothetical protein
MTLSPWNPPPIREDGWFSSGGGGSGDGIKPGEPLTEITGDDGGVGYATPGNVPIFAFRNDGDAHDRVRVWGATVEFGPGDQADWGYIDASSNGDLTLNAPNGAGIQLSAPYPGNGIGFFDKIPVAQPAPIADATDNASAITQLNLLLQAMRDLGLIAT